MKLETKRLVIGILGLIFLGSLILVQALEVTRKQEHAGSRPAHIAVPQSSKQCVQCHDKQTPGIIDHWKGSTRARKGVRCVECYTETLLAPGW